MKKKILLVAALVICMTLAATGTLAYFTASDTAHNVITVGNVDIELEELDDAGNPYPTSPVEVMPGADKTKIVQVKNTGNNAAYVRVKVDTAVVKAEGDTATSDSNITLDFDDTNWTLEGGYYYYNEVLEPGDTTEPLFETVKFSGAGMGNEYQGANITITVQAHAVQVANNEPVSGNIWDAAGWPTATN